MSIQFPRHEQGEYVPLGKYMKPPDKLTFKYADEVRKCYGVAKIKTPSGEVKGVHIRPFDYSTKMLLTEEKMESERQTIIRKLKKNGNRDNLKWKYTTRPANVYYMEEHVGAIKGIGDAKSKALVGALIKTVADVCAMDGDEQKIKEVIKKAAGIGPAVVKTMLDLARGALTGTPPLTVHHLDETNPFESKFGKNLKN